MQEPNDNTTLRESVTNARGKVTTAVQAALAGLAALPAAEEAQAHAALNTAFTAWEAVRQDYDAAVGQPVASRDKALRDRYFDRGSALIAGVEQASRIVEQEMQALDPATSRLVQIRNLVWSARSSAGQSSLALNTALAQKRPLTEAEVTDLDDTDDTARFAWTIASEMIESPGIPDSLKAAKAEADAAYFTGPFSQTRKAVAETLSDGKVPDVDLEKWRVDIRAGLAEISDTATLAVTLVVDDANADNHEANRSFAIIAALVAVALAFAVAGFIVVNRRVVRGMTRLSDSMRTLATGDTEAEIAGVGRRDEIGDMAAAVQVFKDNMIRNTALEAEAKAREAEAAVERRRLMQDLADRFENAVGGIVAAVSSAATELQHTAESMSSAATETAAQATTVAAAAEQAANNVQVVASAAEEMGASVQEIGSQVERSAGMSKLAVSEADQTGALVRELSEGAMRIGNVVQLISGIAAQTNLLALNATIEAARAGDAGKGFAVVAAEVKTLAEQTTRATGEISAQIGTIQAATERAVGVIGGIAGRIQSMDDIAASISAAVEQQGATTQEIVRNITQAATGTGEVTRNITGVAGAADQTGAAASQLLSSSSALSSQAERLGHEVNRFLETVRAA
ncbi:methyl-accepting chemotaxis protein [Pseudoxanthobacter soli]|uniref:methyl-accepting chemotaxis protein n=1 Tax=Pseudoxanthobacter soli TaxID=433840 RepID=UPI0015881297|nr:methyl-accepting chemotaxis protein [Pseudoxanthobacter soli]